MMRKPTSARERRKTNQSANNRNELLDQEFIEGLERSIAIIGEKARSVLQRPPGRSSNEPLK